MLRPFLILLLLVALGVGAWQLTGGATQTGALSGGGGDDLGAPTIAVLEPEDPGRRPLPPTHAAPRPEGHPDDVALEWIELNNEANRHLSRLEYERAIELFERCHAANPDFRVFRLNLAEALVRYARHLHDEEVDLARAVEMLARAIDAGGGREDLDVLREILERWKRELELEENHEVRGSDLFELSYDTTRRDLLYSSQDVLDHLERVYEDLREWFVADPVREGGRPPIRVVLYTRAEFDRLTGLGDWAGGVFDGVVRVPVENLQLERRSWEEVLRHELVHAFIHEIGGRDVPGWLNEGLAQWLEERVEVDAARRKLRAFLDEGRELFAFSQLEGSLATWDDPGSISLAYAQSLVLIDHIATQYGPDVLRGMIAGYANGQSSAESFRRQTAVPLSFVLEDLLRYL